MSDKPVIAIVGAGNLGVALANLLVQNDYRVLLGSRDPEATLRKLRKVATLHTESFEVTTRWQAAVRGDICLLTVPDKTISSVCDELAPHFRHSCSVAHCAGSLDNSALAAAKQRNIAVCSVHPLNTFPSIAAGLRTLKNNKHGTYLYGEGDQSALEAINSVFETIGFHTATLTQASKPLYHAACVFACNYLTVLMDLSLQTAQSGALDSKMFWRALQPLIAETIGNINDGDTESALSGPVIRADTSTIDMHVTALLKVSDSLAATYLDLAKHALSIAVKTGELSDTQIAAVEQVLRLQKKRGDH